MVSVIGEISNKSEPSRKFVQTFVLAEQPGGYYVLNDIFRYLVDDEELVSETTVAEEPVKKESTEKIVKEGEGKKDESKGAEVPAVAAPAVTDERQLDSPAAVEEVDEKLENIEINGATDQPKGPEPTNGVEGPAESKTEEQPKPTPEKAEAETEAEALSPEKPATPDPTPVTSKEPVTAQKQEASPAKPVPAIPKTWANIASRSGATAPVPPAIPVGPPKAPATASPKPAVTQAPAGTEKAAAPSQPAASQPTDSSGWQTAGEGKKQQPRTEEQNVLAYIKNVTDKVDGDQLKDTLAKFGNLKYFDVNRQKVSWLY